MSMTRCDRCSELIDTDWDVECYTMDEDGRHGEGPCLCEVCRQSYYCQECGEFPSDCDDDCHRCLADRYITGKDSLPDDMEIFTAIDWTKGGYAKCLALVKAAKQEAA